MASETNNLAYRFGVADEIQIYRPRTTVNNEVWGVDAVNVVMTAPND